MSSLPVIKSNWPSWFATLKKLDPAEYRACLAQALEEIQKELGK